MLRELGGWRRAVPKPVRDMQNPNVTMRTRARPGMRPANQLGSRAKCFRKKSSRYLQTFQHPPFDHGLEFPAGTQVEYAKATAHIRGIGRLWQNS